MANWRIVDGIEKNQNGSSELKHYGVKGMRWGVRKEYQLKGRKTNNTRQHSQESQQGLSTYSLNTLTNDYKPDNNKTSNSSDYVNSAGSYQLFVLKLTSNPGFLEYAYSKTSGKLFEYISDYDDSFQKTLDINLSLNERKKYKEKCAIIGNQMQDMMDEFDKTHMNDLTTYELEEEKTWAEMIDYVSGFDKSILGQGATITMDRSKNPPVYVYTGPDGKVEYFRKGQEASLEKYAKEHKNDKVDFRTSAAGQRRQKNVDQNAKAVSIKKRDKIEVSDVERLAKSLSRGSSSGKAKATRDYLSKNPEIEKKVQEILNKESEKAELDKISEYKKNRRKKK